MITHMQVNVKKLDPMIKNFFKLLKKYSNH